MLYLIGRALEIIGLILVGTGLLFGLSQDGGFAVEMRLFFMGGAAFIFGYMLERGKRGSS